MMAFGVRPKHLCIVACYLVSVLSATKVSWQIDLTEASRSTVDVSRVRRELEGIEATDSEESNQVASEKTISRDRRSVFLELPPVHLGITNLRVSQRCHGNLLEWNIPAIPFSPTSSYENTEFSFYNIYRSTNFIASVAGLKPYASGSVQAEVRNLTKASWLDRDPLPSTEVWYAVTIVTQNGKQLEHVQSVKSTYIGSFGPSGARIPLTPNHIKGRTLHHAVAYNKANNRYIVVYDVDTNGDNQPDRLYAVQINPNGNIYGRSVMDISANIRGFQGWPDVVHNPIANEYLVVFVVISPALSGGKAVLIAQRLKTHVTQRVTGPSLILKANEKINGKTVFIPLSNHQLLFNPATSGYTVVSELTSSKGTKGIVLQSLNTQTVSVSVREIYSAKVNARTGRAYYDSRLRQIYIAAILPSKAINNRKFKDPFVIVVTKMNGTGMPLKNGRKFIIAGTTNYVFSTVTGYYSSARNRVVMYWERLNAGKRSIKSGDVLIANGITIEGIAETDETNTICPSIQPVRKPCVAQFGDSGGQIAVWEEQQSMRWKIGGKQVTDDAFDFKGNLQRAPLLADNPTDGKVLVVWQESVSATQVNIYARHLEAKQPTCPSSCRSNEICLHDRTCKKLEKESNPCGLRKGGCSHICYKSRNTAVCSCPRGMTLSNDKKTCINKPLGSPMYSLMVAATKRIWHMTKYQSDHASFRLLPIIAQSIVPIAHDSTNGKLYYSDVDSKVIMKSDLSGKNPQPFVSSVTVDGMVVDTKNKKLYFTDMGSKTVEVIDLDGTNRRVLVVSGLTKPRAVTVYSENNKKFLYWSDWGVPGKIERAELHGGGNAIRNRQSVAAGLGWPNGIDVANRVLYVGDAQRDRIESFTATGLNRKTLIPGTLHPYQVLVVNSSLYWSDWSGTISKRVLGSSNTKVLVSGLIRPTGFFFLTGQDLSTSSCQDPGKPSNGKRFGSSFQSGQSVTFACDTGYVLDGATTITCLPSGSWSGSSPVCTAVACSQPQRPINGNMYVIGLSIGDGVVYTCNPGYKMVGSKVGRCQSNGKWSQAEPKCSVLPVFTKRPKNETITVGKNVVLTCDASGTGVKIQWFKDDTPLTPADSTLRVIIFERSIVVTEARFSDAAVFTCIVSNEAGSISSSATIKVLGTRVAKCGERKFGTRQRISGGRIAGEGSHPWIAMMYDPRRKKMFCSGTLISDKWIVTAAHCLQNIFSPSQFVIYLGKSLRLHVDPHQQTRKVDEFHKHPDFSMKTFDSDIALIHLEKPAYITDYVTPICLPYHDLDFKLVDKLALVTIAGWGSKNERQLVNQKLAKKLREIELPIVQHDECQAKLSNPLTKNMICAGDLSGTDACKGDSGGPMEGYNYKTKRHVLVGIVSWGDGCGKTDSYGVYTKVQNYLAWISSHMSKA